MGHRSPLALLLLLFCFFSIAPQPAWAAKKSRKASSSKKVQRKPAAKANSEARPEAQVEKKAPAKNPLEVRTRISLGAGAFYAGGANVGPTVGSTATFTPSFADRRFSLDLEVDWRMARFSTEVAGLGTLASTLNQFPLIPALRIRIFETKQIAFDARVGVGALFVLHTLSSDYAVSTTRSALGWEAFVSGQLRYPINDTLELMFDARLGLGEASVPFVLGRASGVQGLLGVRYALR